MSSISVQNKFCCYILLVLFQLLILGACAPVPITSLPIPATTTPSPLVPSTTPAPTLIPPSPTLSPSSTSMLVNSKYSFEDELNGWEPQTYEKAMACTQVTQSIERAKDGQFSLKLDMDLVGGDKAKSQGEAWVDMRNFPPLNETLPDKSLDLNNQTITIWVYAPTGSLGNNSKPNGFQIFVKDVNYKSNYSSWSNVVEDTWMQLSFTVTKSKVEGGYVDKDFNPSQIIAVGLKMGAGSDSTAVYQGPIYIDAVDW